MGRGEYRSIIGNGATNTPPPKPDAPRTNGRGQIGPEQAPPSPPPAPPAKRDPWAEQARPWSEGQRKDFTRSFALSGIGSVAGAVLWKEHRIWGFLLGGMAGGAVGNLIFAPPPDYPWERGRAW